MNTDSATLTDASYITAAQQSTGRGYLMYNCNVTSTTPGIDTASAYRSKPGYFGRPWAANTSEVVFYKTTVQATDDSNNVGASLISKIGWLDSLGGQSTKMYEYGTMEVAGVDNSASRVSWSSVLKTPVLNDGTVISIAAFLGDWATTLQARGLALDLTDSQFATVSTATGTIEERLVAYISLTSALTSAQAITSAGYTADSFATLTKAIESAKVIAKTDAVVTINTATTTLTSAVAGLVHSSNQSTENETIVSTGDTVAQVVDTTAVIPTGATLKVQAVVSGANYDAVAAIIKQSNNNLSHFAVFEINLFDKDNVAITQLSDNVRVTLAIPSGFDLSKTICVFRVESDGSLTKLDTQIVDGNCIFETNHFSMYVIGEVAAVSTTDGSIVDTTTKTSDTTPIMVYLVLLMVSFGSVMLVIRAKKKEVE